MSSVQKKSPTKSLQALLVILVRLPPSKRSDEVQFRSTLRVAFTTFGPSRAAFRLVYIPRWMRGGWFRCRWRLKTPYTSEILGYGAVQAATELHTDA